MKVAIIMVALLMTSMFAIPVSLARDDRETVSLGNWGDRLESIELEFGSKLFKIELIDTTPNTATIKVTDSNGYSDQKVMEEEEKETILNLEVTLVSAGKSDVMNRKFANLEIELEDDSSNKRSASDVEISTFEDSSAKKRTIVSSTESASLSEVYAESGLSLFSEDADEIELEDDSSNRIFIAYYGSSEDAKLLIIERRKVESSDSDEVLKTESDFRGVIKTAEAQYRVKGESLSNLEIKSPGSIEGYASLNTESKILKIVIENAEISEYDIDLKRRILRSSENKVIEKRGFLERWINSGKSEVPVSQEAKATARTEKKSFGEWIRSLFSRKGSNSGSSNDLRVEVDSSNSRGNSNIEIEVESETETNEGNSANTDISAGVNANLNLRI